MISVILVSVLIKVVFCDDLQAVVVIYRHGDRTPIEPYPTDPYRNASYWPVGFGQLTNLGKMQHYLLGEWLRSRYDGFLPVPYSEKDFYLHSSDADRTLMSAEANLAGLYPPKAAQVWDPSIPWQPVPVHTIPEPEDNLLAMKKDCPRYDRLVEQLFESAYFRNISRINRDLYAYLTKYSGANVTSLERLEYLYNTLSIERLYNFTLPDWTRAAFPEIMRPWAELSFATPTWTPELARYKVGPIFNEIVQFFHNSTSGRDARKMLVFSGHDITISNVLNSMGAFQYHCPPYASTIIFELRKVASSSAYVNIFYKNSSVVQDITLKGCDFQCHLDDFISILTPLLLSRQQWDAECQYDRYYYFNYFKEGGLQYVIYLSAVLSFLIFTMTIFWIYKCCSKIPKEGDTVYTKLPSDEVA